MKIHIDDRFLAIKFDDEVEEVETKAFFTYNDESNVFAGGSYDSRKIKKVQFLKKNRDWHLTNSGFFKELIYFCKENSFKISLFDDKRTKFPHQEKKYTDEELSSYFPFNYNEHQVRAIKKLLKTNIGILKASTSAGKTELFIAYIKLTKLPTLILVNKVSLAIQTYDRIVASGIKDVGLYHGNCSKRGLVVVSTIGSVKKITNLTDFKVLIIDEVHRAVSSQFQDFLDAVDYPIRIGFSATPEGNNKFGWAKIRQYMGDIVEEIGAKELMDNGVIAKPKIQFVGCKCFNTMDWPSANDLCIVNNEDRNNKIKDICIENNKPTLILIKNIEHGKLLEKLIPDSYFISGDDSPQERTEAIKKFTNNDIKFLISSNIFNEGISINAIRVLIIASGGKSRIETVQKIGRSLRLDKNKKEALVYDFQDEGNVFTERHSRMRAAIYKRVGFEVLPFLA